MKIMALEIRLPKEVELKLMNDKDLVGIIKTKIEHEISKEIKRDIFLSMLFDEILEDSELTDQEINILDHRVKKSISEKWNEDNC